MLIVAAGVSDYDLQLPIWDILATHGQNLPTSACIGGLSARDHVAMGCGATRVSPHEHRWRPPAPKVLAVVAKPGAQAAPRHGVVPVVPRHDLMRARNSQAPRVAPECQNAAARGRTEAEVPRSSSTRSSNALQSGFSRSISGRSGSSQTQQPLRVASSRERQQEQILQARIPLVVDGSDLVDLDAQDLKDLLSSWEGQRPPVPPGLRVACAPDRRKHEEHLLKLNCYREEVDQYLETVVQDVDLKRVDHERWLDYREISEGFSGRLDG
eukprot:s1025_g19.t1